MSKVFLKYAKMVFILCRATYTAVIHVGTYKEVRGFYIRFLNNSDCECVVQFFRATCGLVKGLHMAQDGALYFSKAYTDNKLAMRCLVNLVDNVGDILN